MLGKRSVYSCRCPLSQAVGQAKRERISKTMDNSNLGWIIWFAAGFIGAYILGRNPSKLVFSKNFQGTMLRSAVAVLVALSVLTGPFILIVALLLPSQKLCPSCHSAMHIDVTICPKCNAPVPNAQKASKMARQRSGENQLSQFAIKNQLTHFSPEVQKVVIQGYTNISVLCCFMFIGIIGISLILGGFVYEDKGTEIMVVGFIVALVLMILCWALSVRRWWKWAMKQPGVNPDELQKAAEVATLVWPKGHFFERTEFKAKKK